MVQLHPDGTVARWACVPVPASFRQGAEVAEDLGAVCAAMWAQHPRLLIDRLSTVRHCQDPRTAMADTSITAGMWRQLHAGQWPAATKTKAHRTLEEAQAAGDTAAWTLNDWADRLANMASAQRRLRADHENA